MSEERSDRGNDHRERVSKSSGLHQFPGVGGEKSFLSHKNRSNRAKRVPPRTTRLTPCNRQLRLLDELFLLRQQIRFFAQIKKFRRAREITNVRQEDAVVTRAGSWAESSGANARSSHSTPARWELCDGTAEVNLR